MKQCGQVERVLVAHLQMNGGREQVGRGNREQVGRWDRGGQVERALVAHLRTQRGAGSRACRTEVCRQCECWWCTLAHGEGNRWAHRTTVALPVHQSAFILVSPKLPSPPVHALTYKLHFSLPAMPIPHPLGPYLPEASQAMIAHSGQGSAADTL